MIVTYTEKGKEFDFRRVDRVRVVRLLRWWRSGGLLYGYIDRFNVVSIAVEDIIKCDGGTI